MKSTAASLGMAFVYIAGAFTIAGMYMDDANSYGNGSTLAGLGFAGLIIAFITFLVLLKKSRGPKSINLDH